VDVADVRLQLAESDGSMVEIVIRNLEAGVVITAGQHRFSSGGNA
jgi:hypothetical protein